MHPIPYSKPLDHEVELRSAIERKKAAENARDALRENLGRRREDRRG